MKISRNDPFIDKYSWNGINYPLGNDGSRKSKKNDLTIVLNVLYTKNDKNTSFLSFKTQLKARKKIILVMIQDKEKWHYHVVTTLSKL